MLNRRTFATGVSALTLGLAWGRTSGAQTPVASPVAEWSFTDDRGVTIALPKRPERIIAQVNSAATLWDFGVQVSGVFGPQVLSDGSKDPLAGNIDLETITSVGDGWEPIDLERFVALDPDLIVSTTWDPVEGWLWGLGDDATIAQAEAIAPTLAISLLDRSVVEVIARFAELAAALGADLKSPEIQAAKTDFLAASDEVRAAVAENPDLTVAMIAGTPDELFVEGPANGPDGRYFTELGVGLYQPQSLEGYELLSWEQAGTLAGVDLFLNDAREAAGYFSVDQLLEHPTFAALPAVQAGQIGAWHVEYVMSYQGFASVLRALAAYITDASAVG